MSTYRDEMVQVAAVAVAAIQNIDNGTTEVQGTNLLDVLTEVANERKRQETKWGIQNRTPEKWIVILSEEVGEAAKDVLDNNLGV
jgi:hypothetical protein